MLNPAIDNIPVKFLISLGDKEPILNKGGTDRYEEHRTISLVTHACKILTKIMYSRLEHQLVCEVGENVFSFWKYIGTIETMSVCIKF